MTTTTRIRDEALASGYLGQAALEMMRGVFAEQLPRFPGVGDAESIDDLVHSFYALKGAGYANTITALPDDDSARRLTRKWVKNWLVDRVRERPWGALRHRLEKRLQRSELFTPSAVEHYWFLTGAEDIDRSATSEELRVIAASAPVEVADSRSDGPVRLGRTGQLEEMLRRVLDAAGRLHVSELTKICADRFPSLLDADDALDTMSDADWGVIEETIAGTSSSVSTEEQLRDERVASNLMAQLTAEDRAAIRFADNPAALAKELGVGRSSAYSLIKKLGARLTELAGDAERGRGVLEVMIGLVLDDSTAVPSIKGMDMEVSHVE
ncbi:hypothetical protein [Nocardia salmonicida]|uniref:hypothetical protein n=1 Tax=Nocardia salmonicida TaxID=53431 RepID=UPI0007A48A6E|nr:hypothetical protein [Nocardia salmonicida]